MELLFFSDQSSVGITISSENQPCLQIVKRKKKSGCCGSDTRLWCPNPVRIGSCDHRWFVVSGLQNRKQGMRVQRKGMGINFSLYFQNVFVVSATSPFNPCLQLDVVPLESSPITEFNNSTHTRIQLGLLRACLSCLCGRLHPLSR